MPIELVKSDRERPESPTGAKAARQTPEGRWVGVDDGKIDVEGKRIAEVAHRVLAWTADDRRCVLAIDKGTYGTLVEVSLADGAQREVFVQTVHADAVSKLASVAIGPGGELVCGSMYHLMLLAPDGTIAHELKRTDATTMFRAGGGFVTHYNKKLTAYSIVKGKLKKGDSVACKPWVYSVWTADGRWFADTSEDTVEIIGV